MNAFTYLAPTKIIFGKNSENKVGSLLTKGGYKNILIHYGGTSAKKSGLLDRVYAALKDANITYHELGGVVPNPRLSKVYEGIELCQAHSIDFILAVGGGSVIDSAKAIGYGVKNPADIWDLFTGKARITNGCLPLGTIVTLPAAGSEMSNVSVVTNEDGLLKRSLTHESGFCQFAIMNPELTYSLPAYQTASGATDIIMHTLERYFTTGETMPLIDSIAESLLINVMYNTKVALKNPKDYEARAAIMWAASLSHNGVTGDRNYGDWSSHQLEHELSGLFDVAHGAGLAAIWGSWARYVCQTNPARFAQLAVNVLGVPNRFNDPAATALEGIEALEEFFHSIGMPTSIHEMGIELTEEQIKELAYKCSFMGTRTIGGFQKLDLPDIEAIYRMAK
ncbi:MAG TPA: iron-containing alcohol dehydrogenase [Candidatus Avacidaminococcus intestinavium]|uniref:Iron-containing alcohol dehydrogenase n=1 Tax=Candidatus Avacidaminococcus intestinavium TaxID=2840684 RepID=A0A9D1SKW0_9FIRM|nr:iron-containing alcohol dehydrogenase [Candidatus Avacidaminococcus intestinavium]